MADHGADAFPDTSLGIHVFDDQLPGSLPPALLDFVAGHVDGSQKLPHSLADALHARDAGFVVLQYRLGIGLGYRTADADCRPRGSDILILDGDDWVREWPVEADAAWFAGAGTAEGRHYLCDWGWYLVDTDDPGWRRWFTRSAAGQVERSGADGLFLDSVSPPNQLGTWDLPSPPKTRLSRSAGAGVSAPGWTGCARHWACRSSPTPAPGSPAATRPTTRLSAAS